MQLNTISATVGQKVEIKDSFRFWKWGLIAFVSVWSPVIHFIRWSLAPEGYSYYFFHNHDLADWHYILKSADNNFLSIHDVEKDVPIWFRPDCHALLFFPFILIGKWFSLPSFVLLISIDILGNFFCALATFFFFQTLLNDERKSLLAFCLVYFSSGATGFIVLLRWVWCGDFGTALHGWVGENHSLGYDLMEGNMVHWTTIIFRPYYLFPRALGLLSVALLYEAYRTQSRRKIWASAIYLFLATLIHPQSGLIYGTMVGILMLMQAVQEDAKSLQSIKPALWTLSGLIVAGVLWKLYQRIPDVGEAAKEYMKRMYNADALPLFLAMAPMLLPVTIWTLVHTKEKVLTLLLSVLILIYGIAVSEWIIRDESVQLRVVSLTIVLLGCLSALFWKRNYVLGLLRLNTPKVYLGICATVIPIVALSPHHDGLKVLSDLESMLGMFSSIVAALLKALKLIYAAPFRLGIAVPLAGLLALLVSDFPSRLRVVTLTGIFGISVISISLYLFLLLSSKVGYLKNEEQEAMHFLRNLEGKNVMCAGSSQYIIQIAQKRTLIGGVAGVLNLDERKDDILSFFNATSDEVRRKILKKYKIDYVYIGEAEKQLIRLDRNFLVEYPLVYGNSVAEIHVARQEKTEIQE